MGKNTGNLLFTNAMFRQFEGQVDAVGFGFDPKVVNQTYDALLIPAANWLNAGANWQFLIDLLEKVEIPVVTIGLGLQAATEDMDAVRVSDSAVALARLMSAKGAFISTRGTFARDWLASIGISNVVATGCPSLYMRFQPDTTVEAHDTVVIQSTRYANSQRFIDTGGLNADLFDLAARLDAAMIFQSEMEEIDLLVYGAASDAREKASTALLPRLYGLSDPTEFDDWLQRRGKVFFDVDEWATFVRGSAGVIGTRLHGTIMALNNGRPGVLIGHDSRTSELIRFAGIPTLAPDTDFRALDLRAVRHLLSAADLDGFEERRRENAVVYREFAQANGLAIKAGALQE
ncbi:MAG TPA: polysaccharide pyruvyl transferase family protein [Paracoccaceae bacterium]|nr:polysaccharide pyruvyl transferase family protein [Paracoccaceae bacterium]